jgi:predicted Na+-dependent transporter
MTEIEQQTYEDIDKQLKKYLKGLKIYFLMFVIQLITGAAIYNFYNWKLGEMFILMGIILLVLISIYANAMFSLMIIEYMKYREKN